MSESKNKIFKKLDELIKSIFCFETILDKKQKTLKLIRVREFILLRYFHLPFPAILIVLLKVDGVISYVTMFILTPLVFILCVVAAYLLYKRVDTFQFDNEKIVLTKMIFDYRAGSVKTISFNDKSSVDIDVSIYGDNNCRVEVYIKNSDQELELYSSNQFPSYFEIEKTVSLLSEFARLHDYKLKININNRELKSTAIIAETIREVYKKLKV